MEVAGWGVGLMCGVCGCRCRARACVWCHVGVQSKPGVNGRERCGVQCGDRSMGGVLLNGEWRGVQFHDREIRAGERAERQERLDS